MRRRDREDADGDETAGSPADRPARPPAQDLAFGKRDPDLVSSVADRLARLDLRARADADASELQETADGIDAARRSHRRAGRRSRSRPPVRGGAGQTGGASRRERQVAGSGSKPLLDAAVVPLATNPTCGSSWLISAARTSRSIDDTSVDEVIACWLLARSRAHDRRSMTSGSSSRTTRTRSPPYRSSTAIHISSDSRFKDDQGTGQRHRTSATPWTPEGLWAAYEALDRSKVRGSGQRTLTDLVSLVRFTLGEEDELVPYPETVNERFAGWLLQQEQAGRTFTHGAAAWLEEIRDHIAASMGISTDDFDYMPFVERGGIGKAYEVFGTTLARYWTN